jgi:hypothetical protein
METYLKVLRPILLYNTIECVNLEGLFTPDSFPA